MPCFFISLTGTALAAGRAPAVDGKITYKLQKTEQSDFFIERPKNKTYKNLKLEPTSLNNNVFLFVGRRQTL